MKQLKSFYSRKATSIRMIISTIACAVSAVFVQNERLLLIVLALATVGVLFMFIMFCKGMDKGSFAPFYSQENILKRYRIVRYISLIIMYFSFVAIFFFQESVAGYVIGSVFIVPFAIESILFFKTEKES